MNSKSYDRITERIVSLLTQGTVPWHKPWQVKTGLPRNLVSQKPYRGINVFLLMAMNYESPHWVKCEASHLSHNVEQLIMWSYGLLPAFGRAKKDVNSTLLARCQTYRIAFV